MQPIDQFAGNEGFRQLRAGFDEKPVDAAFGQHRQDTAQIGMAVAPLDGGDLDTGPEVQRAVGGGDDEDRDA